MLSPYVQSKRAIAEYANEVAKARNDIHVVTLLPGPVDTELFRHGKGKELLQDIEMAAGILTTDSFSTLLFELVLPQARAHPSGAAVRMYKSSGIHGIDQL